MDRLLLHICCAPDATVAFERLRERYYATGFFYNPNIEPQTEYDLREAETRFFTSLIGVEHISEPPQREVWSHLTSPYHSEPERGKRCQVCITHRLEMTAIRARELGFPIFTTTLTTSPHKDAEFIHQCGRDLAEKFGLEYLAETFRSKDGFKRSIDLSRLYGLYRQDYCGCRYSLAEARGEWVYSR